MNVKRIAALSLVALAVGFSSAKADPWGHGRGWVRPHVSVEFRLPAPRIFVPPVPVVVQGTYYGHRPHRVVEYRQQGCNQGYYNNGCNRPAENCNNGYNQGYNQGYSNDNCNNGYNSYNSYNGNYNNGYNQGYCR